MSIMVGDAEHEHREELTMPRDRVKMGVAESVARAMRQSAAAMRYRLAESDVQDVEVQPVTELETQVKVVFGGMPPRYFLVKLSEKF